MECEDHSAIAIVRQRARQTDHAARMKRRSVAFNLHRSNLDEIAKDIKIPSVDEVRQLSIQLKEKKQFSTLHKLRVGLAAGEESITAFLKTEGALYSLIGCLTGDDVSLRKEAVNTLINLGCGTKEQCEQVHKAAGVYIMCAVISKPCHYQDAYAWCIGNLCGGSESVCKAMRGYAIYETLETFFKSRIPHISQSASYALAHYFATVPGIMKTIQTEAIIRLALNALEEYNEATYETALLLFVMSSDIIVCDQLLCQGFIPIGLGTLEKILNRQRLDVNSATAILRIFINCIGACPSSATEVCKRDEQFVGVSRALLYSSFLHFRTETLQFIANVINGACQTATGTSLVEDLNLRPRLESPIRSALAANFSSHPLNVRILEPIDYNNDNFT